MSDRDIDLRSGILGTNPGATMALGKLFGHNAYICSSLWKEVILFGSLNREVPTISILEYFFRDWLVSPYLLGESKKEKLQLPHINSSITPIKICVEEEILGGTTFLTSV